MKTKAKDQQTEINQDNRPHGSPFNAVQGFIASPQVFLSRDGETLIHRLPGNMKLELHVNLFNLIRPF